MKSIVELESWMLINNITNTITPSSRFVTDEGEGLEIYNQAYIWYYIEKGIRYNIEFFKKEEEAVNYIYNYLKRNER